MTSWVVARHQVTLAGRVVDAHTGRAIGGAQVRIAGAPSEFSDWLAAYARQYGNAWASLPERPDQTRTGMDGQFHFIDLPDGQYTLVAGMPGSGTRYGSVEADASVSHDDQGHIDMMMVQLDLPPTAIQGQVTDRESTPIVLAEVHVRGSGECAITDSQGRYLLARLEVGNRTISVSVQGYQPASEVVELASPGVTQTLNFSLDLSTP